MAPVAIGSEVLGEGIYAMETDPELIASDP